MEQAAKSWPPLGGIFRAKFGAPFQGQAFRMVLMVRENGPIHNSLARSLWVGEGSIRSALSRRVGDPCHDG